MPSVTLTTESIPDERRPLGGPVAHALRHAAPRLAALLPGVICRGQRFDEAGAPQLYVTIDDGPAAGDTPYLLEALDRLGVRATHFVIGSRAARDPGLARAILDAGHSLANHGWEHLDAWRAEGAVESLRRGEEWLEEALGLATRDARPPYGHVTPSICRWACAGDRRIVLWDHMPGEFLPSPSVETLAAQIVRSARPGAIVVLHDGLHARRAASVLSIAVPALLEKGWRFNTLTSTC